MTEATMDYRKVFGVDPDAKFKLKKIDPNYVGKHMSADEAKQATEAHQQELFHQQGLLYAEHKHSVLVVLQALDAGGKDGTIKHVFRALNPQGTHVVSFKQPTPPELAHDFLWRVHPHAPGRGEIAIFNRSHYEDVLVPWVHKQIDKATWTTRIERIREFEALLSENRTTIIKFFLHISKEEQLARFAQRLEDPARNWKISEADYTERAFWDDYIGAFEAIFRETSTRDAPWYIIPANHKWFRDLAVSQIMADTMSDLKLKYPPPSVDLEKIRRKYHEALEANNGARKKA
jgi:PPK2 family polyphosphate:nucleotide phosphotransferase